MDSAGLHEAAHRIHDGDPLAAVAALLRVVAEMALELEELRATVHPRHQSPPELGVED